MKKNLKKLFSLLILIIFSITLVACKDNDENEDVKPSDKEKIEEVEKVKNDKQNEKQETVYAILNKYGEKQQVYVSDLIINNQCDETILDMSDLSNIKNVNGTEKCSYTGTSLTWMANKKDINYIGTSNKELPVSMNIKYYLNGVETKYEDMQNKKGHITIKIDYTCNQYKNYTINGNNVKLYAPYLVISGMYFNNKTNANIEGDNIKVINDGSKSVILTYAFPGINENLNMENINVPSSVEFSFDTTNFNVETTFSLVSNSILNTIDMSQLDSTKDELDNKVEELKQQLMKVLEGTHKLYLGTQELLTGVNTLADKIKEMAEGINALSSNSQSLRDGATQVFNQLLQTVNDEFSNNGIPLEALSISNYQTVLNSLLTNPTEEQEEALIIIASNSLELKLASVPSMYQDAVKVILFDSMKNGKTLDEATDYATLVLQNASIVNSVISNESITPDATVYSALVNQGVDSTSAGVIAKLCTYLQLQNGEEAINYINEAQELVGYATTLTNAMNDENKETKIKALCLNLAKATLSGSVEEAINKLDSYKEFYDGLNTYTGSIDYMATQIEDQELVSKLQELVKGVTDLNDGTKELDEKLNEFYNETIEVIMESYETNSSEVFLRLKYMMELVSENKMFTYLPENMTGSTTYIYTTK